MVQCTAADQSATVQSTAADQPTTVQSTAVDQSTMVPSTAADQPATVQSTAADQPATVQNTAADQPATAAFFLRRQEPELAPKQRNIMYLVFFLLIMPVLCHIFPIKRFQYRYCCGSVLPNWIWFAINNEKGEHVISEDKSR
jgi:hypothetical protein